MMQETTNFSILGTSWKIVKVVPSMISVGIFFLIAMLVGLVVMFIWFPSFFFILKYTLMAIVGLSMFSVTYSLLTTFVKEYAVTGIVSLAIAMGITLAMRTLPFYITIAITIIVLIAYLILKTSGITRIFERPNNREIV